MKKIYDVCEFFKEIKEECRQLRGEELLFFRGLSDKRYDLLPSVFRSSKKDAESNAYHDIMVEYPEQFKTREHLSNLVKMQHYGSATRLLDVSGNPLISLYFACEQSPKENGKVVCFKVKKSEILHHNSDKALMLACLSMFSDEEKENVKKFCEFHRGVISDRDIANNNTMKRFLHEIRSEFPAFETAIVGEDLLRNYFVAAFKDNQRMKVQDGAFIIFGLTKDTSNLQQITTEIEIDCSAKQEILKDLKILGIANNTIYPDFERTSMAIANDRKAEWVNIYRR
ncbi:MAG: FRG domain-containing protein [Clostridiales bacterium]|nr:FRG domain-containing protein [Clostridiales bacterium]